MNRKKQIGITVGVLAVLAGIVVAVVLFLYGNTGSKGDAYLVTVPPDDYYEVRVGVQSFEISCEGRSYDNTEWSQLQWMNPREEYISEDYGNPRTYKTGNNSLKLEFRYPALNDSGVYTCSGYHNKEYQIRVTIHFVGENPNISNTPGYITSTTEFDISSPDPRIPEFQVRSEDVTAFEETEVELECSAMGAEPMTYEWFNQRNEIIRNGSSIYTYPWLQASYLTFTPVQSIHQGQYSCVAENEYGRASKDFHISVYKDGTPKFNNSYEFVKAEAGSEFQLHCEAWGERPMTYTWLDQSDQIISDNSPFAQILKHSYGSILVVKRAESSHSGSYTCTASNRKGLAAMIFEVDVVQSGVPTFSRTCENVTAGERSKLELFCCAENEDGGTNYTWRNQNNQTVTANQASTVYASTTLKGSVLSISAVESSEVYECSARNEKGVASKFYYIEVSSASNTAPKFDKNYEYVLAEEDSSLALRCIASGEGPITYEWYNQRDEVIPSDAELPVHISMSEDGSVLVIKKVEFSHKGTYTCQAQNQFGIYSKVFNISVYPSTGNDTNGISIRHVDVRKVTSNSVLFGIATSGSVDEIEMKYTESRNKTEQRISFKSGDEYEVKGLVPEGLYNFSFRVVLPTNSSWTEAYKVILLPDKPEVIIRNVQPDRLQIEWFRTTDSFMRETVLKHEISYKSVQIQRGSYWEPSTCVVTIDLPSCRGSSYTLTGLYRNIYYELQVRAFTASGFGEAYKHKFFLP